MQLELESLRPIAEPLQALSRHISRFVQGFRLQCVKIVGTEARGVSAIMFIPDACLVCPYKQGRHASKLVYVEVPYSDIIMNHGYVFCDCSCQGTVCNSMRRTSADVQNVRFKDMKDELAQVQEFLSAVTELQQAAQHVGYKRTHDDGEEHMAPDRIRDVVQRITNPRKVRREKMYEHSDIPIADQSGKGTDFQSSYGAPIAAFHTNTYPIGGFLM